MAVHLPYFISSLPCHRVNRLLHPPVNRPCFVEKSLHPPVYWKIAITASHHHRLTAAPRHSFTIVKLIDETVNSQLREKYGEKMSRMQRHDDEAFALYDELFSYACPKFITPSAPSYEEPLVNYNQDT